MANKKNDMLTAKELIARLSDLAEIKPDAEVCFVMPGDCPNEGWPICEAGLIFDSAKARVLLVNDDGIVR